MTTNENSKEESWEERFGKWKEKKSGSKGLRTIAIDFSGNGDGRAGGTKDELDDAGDGTSNDEGFGEHNSSHTQGGHMVGTSNDEGFGEHRGSHTRGGHMVGKENKTMKYLLLLIPLAIFLYVLYANVIASHEFTYVYEAEDEHLTPANRISAVSEDGRSRELTGHLVYFDVPIARGAETVDVSFRFKDTLPEGATMYIGARDAEEWSYTYKSVYNPALDKLSEFERIGNVYRIHTDFEAVDEDALVNIAGAVIATDGSYRARPNFIDDFSGESVIDVSLRGAHTAYVYTSGELILDVVKQDINWYEGEDVLDIVVYDSSGAVVGSTQIADDGEVGVNKERMVEQEEQLVISGLPEGVYRIEFSDFDGLLKEISVNSGKIVFDRLFLADNELYDIPTRETTLFTEVAREEQLLLLTYHREGLQDISYTFDGERDTFEFDIEDSTVPFDLSPGAYSFTFPENDVIVGGSPYFAFSEEQYFEPFTQKVVPLRNDFAWIEQNVDYVISSYQPPTLDGEWVIGSATFDLEEDGLYYSDSGLSLVFNTPHFSEEAYAEVGVPLESIEIKVYKPGVFS